MLQTITDSTWDSLTRACAAAVADGWATPGVFAAGVGPEYEIGSPTGVLYVGKSGGPLVESVGLCYDQNASATASRKWMLGRRNRSAFWVFADLLEQRESLAWSNLAKIDTRRARPPSARQWQSISGACIMALTDEIECLAPGKIVFAISEYQVGAVLRTLRHLGYCQEVRDTELDRTLALTDRRGRLAVVTRHPQGWRCDLRDRVASFVRCWGGANRSVA